MAKASGRELIRQLEAAGIIVKSSRVNVSNFMAECAPSVDSTEEEFQERVIDLAHSLTYEVAHFRVSRVMRNGRETWETPVAADGKGFPDLLMIREDDPRIVVAELKAKKNTPSERQLLWLKLFKLAGIPAFCWWPKDWPEIVETLKYRSTLGRRRCAKSC